MVEGKSMIVIKTISYLILAMVVVICVYPFFMIVSASFSTESSLIREGYGFLPREFSLTSYKYVMSNGETLFNSYMITILTTVIGSALSLLVTAMTAYPLTRKSYSLRNKVSFFLYFTMLFSGGTIPTYILISQYLRLTNNILVLIIPMLVSVYNVFIMRTYFAQISDAVIEAAKIDGAGEYYILFKIVMPMSITGLATMLLLISLSYWNQWYACLMYMTTDKKITLQYYLYRTMSNIESILKSNNVSLQTTEMPSETARMAMCVLGAGPMVIVFMFFQKYFVHGISVGSVKG